MRIGIISQETHAQSHMKALEKAGFAVEILGGSVQTIPPRIDIVIVRTQSCSHAAQAVALAWMRSTGKGYICTNSLSAMVREAEAYREKFRRDDAVDKVRQVLGVPANLAAEFRPSRENNMVGVRALISHLGFFHAGLALCQPAQVIQFVDAKFAQYTQNQGYSKHTVGTSIRALKDSFAKLNIEAVNERQRELSTSLPAFTVPLPGTSLTYTDAACCVVGPVLGAETSIDVAFPSDMWRTPELHEELLDFINGEAGVVPRWVARPRIALPEVAPQPAPIEAVVLEEVAEPVVSPVVVPDLEEVPVVPDASARQAAFMALAEGASPAPTPVPAPVAVTAQPTPTNPLVDVHAAVRLLHECMQAAGVSRLLIADGKVTLTYTTQQSGCVREE
jgi:hypothetical protein